MIDQASQLIIQALRPDSAGEIERLHSRLAEIQEWDIVARRVVERQAAPLLMHRLKSCSLTGLVPQAVIAMWEQAGWKTLSRTMLLSEAFKEASEALSQYRIEHIPMKGIYLAEQLYPETGLRQFSDIDILVHRTDSDEAVEVLKGLGYKEAGLTTQLPADIHAMSDASHRPPLVRNGIMIEIHSRVHRRRENWLIDHGELWRTAESVLLYGRPVKVFSTEYQLITVAIHLDKHFREGKFQFTGYYDLVYMLRKWGSSIHWEEVLSICKLSFCTKAVLTHLAITHRYFDAPVPDLVKQHPDFSYNAAQALTFEEVLTTGKAHQLLTLGSLNPVKTITGFKNKIRFIWFYLFPPVSFLMKQFGLKKRSEVWKYYPYRFLRRLAKAGLTIWNRIKLW